ncbi:MAG: hypothetical protein KC457_34430 [Myxococcales bacterium]|nr:hypothetical protein [Myxococcales bacterium]
MCSFRSLDLRRLRRAGRGLALVGERGRVALIDRLAELQREIAEDLEALRGML